jgi:hypothetical protein
MKYNITLKPVKEKEISYLKEKMDESFAIAVREHFGDNKPNVSPPLTYWTMPIMRPVANYTRL